MNIKEGTYIVACKIEDDGNHKKTSDVIQMGKAVLVDDITWRHGGHEPSVNIYIIETENGYRLKLSTKIPVRLDRRTGKYVKVED